MKLFNTNICIESHFHFMQHFCIWNVSTLAHCTCTCRSCAMIDSFTRFKSKQQLNTWEKGWNAEYSSYPAVKCFHLHTKKTMYGIDWWPIPKCFTLLEFQAYEILCTSVKMSTLTRCFCNNKFHFEHCLYAVSYSQSMYLYLVPSCTCCCAIQNTYQQNIFHFDK